MAALPCFVNMICDFTSLDHAEHDDRLNLSMANVSIYLTLPGSQAAVHMQTEISG